MGPEDSGCIVVCFIVFGEIAAHELYGSFLAGFTLFYMEFVYKRARVRTHLLRLYLVLYQLVLT